ncbi:MAG: ParA family protein [Lachnospiraceae bacterium]|nr:ParA family protein [Lachnospiraceae bacterium]
MDRKFYIVCGHYGCGKSNFSINLALELAEKGRKVIMMDLDLVNPYFLSSAYSEMLEEKGIKVIAPMFANSNVETPGLPAEMNLVFETDCDVVMDVGGDDAGSVVLGRFHEQLANTDYEMIYLINHYRNLTMTPEETAQVLREIEAASRCKASAVVANSHLKQETTWETVQSAIPYAKETAKELNLPLKAVTIPSYLAKDDRVKTEMNKEDVNWYPVEIYVKAPWE